MSVLKFKKKVLVISNFAPPASGGSPHVFFNLFTNYGQDSYVIYTHEKNLQSGDMRRKLPCTYYTYAPARGRLLGPIHHLTAFIRAITDGLKIIEKERVEVIVGTADKGTALLLTLALSVLSLRPYVLYMLDPYRGTDFTPIRKIFSAILEPLFFNYARVVVTTNDGHRDLYRKTYGDRFHYAVLYHASPAPKSEPETNSVLPASPYTILYSGSIYYAQEQSIHNLIRAIEDMPDLSIQLLLYVPKREQAAQDAYGKYAFVSVRSAAPGEMATIQQQADILFLPLSWVLPKEVTGMAIPGKTPEYLVAGKPILVHAPPQAYLCEYAREEGFACVVDTEDIEVLKESVRTLLKDQPYREMLVGNARRAFARHHNAVQNAIRFAEIINEL